MTAARGGDEDDLAEGFEEITKPWGRVVLFNGEQIGRVIKSRREFALDKETSLEPDNLIGSSFLAFDAGVCIWQGVVVGEPGPSRFLCHIDRLDEDVESVQRIFALDTLLGLGSEGRRLVEGGIESMSAPVVHQSLEFRFYDSEHEARTAYIAWAHGRGMEELRASMGEEVIDDDEGAD